MPRTTEFFGAPLTNVGPLTTTYTAPASCATGFRQWNVALKNTNHTTLRYGYLGAAGTTCTDQPVGECLPSGAKFDELAKAATTTYNNGYLAYFSPGLHCPSGWETAGVAVGSMRPTSGADLHATPTNASGIFTQDPWPYEPYKPNASGLVLAEYLPEVKYFMSIIKDSETVILCCPSGFTANVQGGCHSEVGRPTSLGVSQDCRIDYEYEYSGTDDGQATITSFDGTIWNPPLASVTSVVSPSTVITRTDDLPKSLLDDSNLVVVSQVAALALIHDEKDKSNGGFGRPKGSLVGLFIGALAATALLL